MALVNCPECGKEISSLARACPNCGCPVEEMRSGGTVKIKMPNVDIGLLGLFSSRKATVETGDGKILWEGLHGQTANFDIEKSVNILIRLGSWANPFGGRIEPRKKYACVQDMGIHWKATFRLTEVDIIDAD